MKFSTKILVFSISLGLASLALLYRSIVSLAALPETPGDRRPKALPIFGDRSQPVLARVVRYASSGDYRAPLLECEVGGKTLLALPAVSAVPLSAGQEVELLRVEWPITPPDGERVSAVIAIASDAK